MRDREPVGYTMNRIKHSRSELNQMKVLGDKHAAYLKSGNAPLEGRKLSIVILSGMEENAFSYLTDVKSFFINKGTRTVDDEETLRLIDVELKKLEMNSR